MLGSYIMSQSKTTSFYLLQNCQFVIKLDNVQQPVMIIIITRNAKHPTMDLGTWLIDQIQRNYKRKSKFNKMVACILFECDN